MCILFFFFFIVVCIRRLIHDKDMYVNTYFTGGSIKLRKIHGLGGPTCRILLPCLKLVPIGSVVAM